MAEIEYLNKTIYNITRNFKLKHKIKFGKKNQKGDRMDSVYKYDFQGKNYNNPINLTSINIDTSDYLVLEYSSKDNKVDIYLSYPHLYNFKRLLKTAVSWFYKEKYSDMFIITDDDIKFNSKYRSLAVRTDVTIDGREIAIKPSIIERDDLYSDGVIFILDGQVSISLDIFELESLYDVINNFNLYQASAIWTSYVLSSNPEKLLANMNNNFKDKEKIPKVDEFKKTRKKKKVSKAK